MSQILVLNSGSTSLKYKLFGLNSLELIQENYFEHITDHKKAVRKALREVKNIEEIKAIGHRVVHGGGKFIKPTVVNKKVLKELENFSDLAPLHNPANLAGIRACIELLPRVKNVACFDTAFHATIPDKANFYALPWRLTRKLKIERFGFHGLSHNFVSEEVAKKLGKKLGDLNLITIHLGGGASISAIKKGKVIDTSMGFTPLEGLMMMSRGGNIDPGILIYLTRKKKWDFKKIDQMLNYESGMKGICGTSNMKEVLTKVRQGNKKAKLALDMYVYRIQKYIGSYLVVLSRVDALVFTGAIGFRSRLIRSKIIKDIKNSLKGVKVFAVKTDEELMIAREIKNRLLGN